MSEEAKAATGRQAANVNPVVWIYGVLSPCMVMYFFIWGNGHGFFKNTFAFIVLSIVAFIGALAGDLIRKICMPNYIFAKDMTDKFLQNIFWLIGPQFIGMYGCAWFVAGRFFRIH